MTLLVSIILGAATGFFINMKKLFETIPDDQLFNDELFWVIADDDNAGFYQPEVITNSRMNRRKMHHMYVSLLVAAWGEKGVNPKAEIASKEHVKRLDTRCCHKDGGGQDGGECAGQPAEGAGARGGGVGVLAIDC